MIADEASELESDSIDFRDSMKGFIRQGIDEWIDEVFNSEKNIVNQAIDFIHSNEIIMTIGNFGSVGQLLKEAGKKKPGRIKRNFQVIIAESAPNYSGHQLAKELAECGIMTTLITDSAIFAVMSRVNKVFISPHAGCCF
jgi:translation initiation factor eIF-2B subunit beta